MKHRSRFLRRRGSPATVALGFAILGLALCGCGERNAPLPHGLVGTYESTDPRYAGRYLTLTDTAVVIGLGEGESERYRIRSIVRSDEANETIYTVEYLAPYGRDQLRFVEKDGTISLANQRDVRWVRGELRP